MALDFFAPEIICDECDEVTPRFTKTGPIRRCEACHKAWKQSLLPPKPAPPVVLPPPTVLLCRWTKCAHPGGVATAGFCRTCYSRFYRAGQNPRTMSEPELAAFMATWSPTLRIKARCQWPGCTEPGHWCATHFSRFRYRKLLPTELSPEALQQFIASWTPLQPHRKREEATSEV